MIKLKKNMVASIKFKKFWKWFNEKKDFLKPEQLNDDMLKELNDKILTLGDFNWEIREGDKKSNMLIISPGGDLNLLPLTKRIVDFAPTLSEWEFYHHKPAKDWEYQFYIEEEGVKKMIDLADWEYVLLKFPDDTYDILIKGKNLRTFAKDRQYDLVDIALESILGEELSLKLIKNVDIVEDFSTEHINQKGSIKHLKNHILELKSIS